MKPRTRKVLRWIGFFLAGLALLVGLFLVEEHVRGRVQLNRYLARMKARGEKFGVVDLAPAPALPGDNGAGLFMASGFGAGKVVNENLPVAMRYAAPGKTIAMVHRPVWVVRKKGTLSLETNGVVALWRTNTGPDTPSVRGQHLSMLITREDVAADVGFFSNQFVQVRRALTYPVFDFGVNYASGWNIPLPQLVRTKTAANWLRAASLDALFQTNRAAALENLLALAALSCVTTNEPILITQLIRYAVFQIAVGAAWEALQMEGWTDEELAELQRAFSAFEAVHAMERALEMERAIGMFEIDRASRDPATYFKNYGLLKVDVALVAPTLPADYDELIEPITSVFQNIEPIFNRYLYVPVWNFAWKDQDKLRALEYWQRTLDALRAEAAKHKEIRETTKWSADGLPDLFFSIDPERKGPPRPYDRIRFLISSLIDDQGERSVRRAALAETTRELVVTAIALRRHHLAHGRPPKSLNELVPAFLPRAPADPFDGKPLRYREKEDGTFVLYSIGPNRKDENGDASPEVEHARPNFLNGRDIVWPRAATEEEIWNFIEAEAGRSRKPRAP